MTRKRHSTPGVNSNRPRRQWKTGPITYDGAIQRVLRTRGRAADYPCADCSERTAAQWQLAAEPTAPGKPATSGRRDGQSFSADPADYRPLCWICLRDEPPTLW